MSCYVHYPKYANEPFRGVAALNNIGDGYSEQIRWFQAVSPSYQFQVVYNIYYSTVREDVFSDGVKFVSIDPAITSITLNGFTPGDQYFFAVRASLFELSKNTLSTLKDSQSGLKTYPESFLTVNVGLTDVSIPISDPETFPPYGIIQVGHELIYYNGIDLVTNELIGAKRGFYNSNIRIHNTDGYDGYFTQNPIIHYFYGFEDRNISVLMEENKFAEPFYPYTDHDGYKEVIDDVLHIDNSASDSAQIDFPPYDFSGYHSTDPRVILAGECVGSYIGGERGCADGYGMINEQIRGLSVVQANDQRQEVLLSTEGEAVVLMKRLWTGKVCFCMDSNRESTNPRCKNCFGSGFVSGYQQYHFPRRSDGRIMVRFDPSVEDLIPQDSGMESTFNPNSWTLSVPTVRDRDFFVRFNTDSGTNIEEYRYEILRVTRNKLVLNDFGAQKMELARIRKTDPIYQVPVFRNTATMPRTISTGIGYMKGPGGQLIPHVHSITVSETITSITQINQMTEISQGHNHYVINGVVNGSSSDAGLNHTHDIILV